MKSLLFSIIVLAIGCSDQSPQKPVAIRQGSPMPFDGPIVGIVSVGGGHWGAPDKLVCAIWRDGGVLWSSHFSFPPRGRAYGGEPYFSNRLSVQQITDTLSMMSSNGLFITNRYLPIRIHMPYALIIVDHGGERFRSASELEHSDHVRQKYTNEVEDWNRLYAAITNLIPAGATSNPSAVTDVGRVTAFLRSPDPK